MLLVLSNELNLRFTLIGIIFVTSPQPSKEDCDGYRCGNTSTSKLITTSSAATSSSSKTTPKITTSTFTTQITETTQSDSHEEQCMLN